MASALSSNHSRGSTPLGSTRLCSPIHHIVSSLVLLLDWCCILCQCLLYPTARVKLDYGFLCLKAALLSQSKCICSTELSFHGTNVIPCLFIRQCSRLSRISTQYPLTRRKSRNIHGHVLDGNDFLNHTLQGFLLRSARWLLFSLSPLWLNPRDAPPCPASRGPRSPSIGHDATR